MRPVRPISEVALGRPQEAGKIKLGKKVGGNGRPTSIETFRFVSRERDQVDKLAVDYGGTVQVVAGQYDLESEASKIDVILPPDPLGGTPVYELWSAGGCQRRCDGEECVVPIQNGDDVDLVDQPCICRSREKMECKPTVRLSVLLPQVSLTGVWNLKTNSWAATREMQQMVGLIEMAQNRGLVAATLAIEKREQTTAGRKRKFVVPVLRLEATLAELASGSGAALPEIAAPPRLALPSHASLSEEDRLLLRAAWGEADAASREDAVAFLHLNGITELADMPASLVGDVLDRLVVHEPS